MASKFVQIISVLTARDPRVVAELDASQRARVTFEAACFLVLGALLYAQWSRFLGEQMGLAGVIAALVPTILVLGMDYAMGASLEHRLAHGDRGVGYWMTVATRFAFALVLSGVLAMAWIIGSYAPTLDEISRQVRAQAMAPLVAEMESERKALREQIVAPRQAQLEALQAERRQLQGQIAELRARRQQFDQAASEAVLEAEVERHGAMGRPRGKGPEYMVAIKRSQLAHIEALRARDDLTAAVDRMAIVDRDLATAQAELVQAQAALKSASDALQLRMKDDPRYLPEVNGNVLGRTRALLRLMNDPEQGPIIIGLTIGIFALLVALECSYLMSKVNTHGLSYGQRALLRQRADDEAYARDIAAELAAMESEDVLQSVRKSQPVRLPATPSGARHAPAAE
jgi:hypothetical protein